jgi:uncharacterized protein
VSDLLNSFSVFALKTDLSETLMAAGDQIFDRIELFNSLKDDQGLMVLNNGMEDLINVTVPLGGLDALQAQSQEQMASVAKIPTLKLLGTGPRGMNASSGGELRVFYDAFSKFILATKLRCHFPFHPVVVVGSGRRGSDL